MTSVRDEMHRTSDRCLVTGNVCGTDTWRKGEACVCPPCQTLANAPALAAAKAEASAIADQIRALTSPSPAAQVTLPRGPEVTVELTETERALLLIRDNHFDDTPYEGGEVDGPLEALNEAYNLGVTEERAKNSAFAYAPFRYRQGQEDGEDRCDVCNGEVDPEDHPNGHEYRQCVKGLEDASGYVIDHLGKENESLLKRAKELEAERHGIWAAGYEAGLTHDCHVLDRDRDEAKQNPYPKSEP